MRLGDAMTYQEAKTRQAALETAYKAASDNRAAVEAALAERLGIPARGAMNLIAEPIRLHPDYRTAKTMQDSAFNRLRIFNADFVKAYKKEIREERSKRFA